LDSVREGGRNAEKFKLGTRSPDVSRENITEKV
jgi:hypothetical protein